MYHEPPGTYYDDLECYQCDNSGAYKEEDGESDFAICRECWLEREVEQLRAALRGMMAFYGMDEDRYGGDCEVTWQKAWAAMHDIWKTIDGSEGGRKMCRK